MHMQISKHGARLAEVGASQTTGLKMGAAKVNDCFDACCLSRTVNFVDNSMSSHVVIIIRFDYTSLRYTQFVLTYSVSV